MAEIVIIFIIAMAFAGIVFQLWAFRGYGAELENLKRVENAMQGMDVGEPIDTLITRTALSGRGIVGHRITQVRDIARSPAPPSSADISAADLERDDSRLNSLFPNTLISILLIIGLAGTLISFNEIFRDVPRDSKTTEEIKKWISTAYPAFSNAFRASLCGIVGTVLLLVMRSFVHNRRAELFDRLDRFTTAPLYPRFVERQVTDATTLTLAGQQLLQSSASFEKSVAVLERMSDAIISAATQTHDALHSAKTTFAEFQGSFAAGGAIRDNLNRLEGIVAGLGSTTKEITSDLRNAVLSATDALIATTNSIKQTGDSVATVAANIAQCVAQLLAGDTSHVVRIDKLVGSLGEIVAIASRNQSQWSDAISPAIRAMAESAGRMGQSIVSFNNGTAALMTMAGQIEKSTGRVADMSDVQVKRFETSAAKIEHAISLSTSDHQGFLEKLMGHLNAAIDGQSKRFEAVAEKLDHSAELITSGNRELLSGLEPALKEMPRQITQQEALLRQLHKTGEELKEAISRAGVRAASTKRGIFGRIAFWRK